MRDDQRESEVTYPDAWVEDATMSFIRDRFMLFVVGLVALPGPVYLCLLRFYTPRKLAGVLKPRLQATARVTIGSTRFALAANGRAVALPRSDVRRVVEFPDYFLLVTARLAFAIISKRGLPEPSHNLIRNAAASRAA